MIVLAIVLRALPVQADPEADQLFDEGTALLEKGAYGDALAKLEAAQQRDPGLGTRFNIAVCHEELGRLATALHEFEDVADGARAAGKTTREQAARARLAQLRPRVPTVAIVPDPRDARDLVVRLDGLILDVSHPVVLDPGDHALTAAAPMKQTWATTMTTPAEGVSLTIAIPRLALVEGTVITVTRETSDPKRTIGVLLGGVGVASGVAAIVTSVMVAKAHATAADRCTPKCIDANGTYDSTGANAVSRGRTLLPINAVVWVFAVAGIGAGTFLVLTSHPKARVAAALLGAPISF